MFLPCLWTGAHPALLHHRASGIDYTVAAPAIAQIKPDCALAGRFCHHLVVDVAVSFHADPLFLGGFFLLSQHTGCSPRIGSLISIYRLILF